MQERGLTAESLRSAALAILTEAGRAEAMARAALSLGRPDAAERLADLVTTLATGKKESAA